MGTFQLADPELTAGELEEHLRTLEEAIHLRLETNQSMAGRILSTFGDQRGSVLGRAWPRAHGSGDHSMEGMVD